MAAGNDNPMEADYLSGGQASWIDFSGTENPFGTPDSFVRAIVDAASNGVLSYNPDRSAYAFRNALARIYSLPAESFLVGATPGAMIRAAAQTFEPCSVGVTAPCPTEYVLALSNAGHRIRKITLTSSYSTPVYSALEAQKVQVDAVVLANPSYPTSRLLAHSILDTYLKSCDWVVVDERSIKLTLGGRSFADLTAEYKNLIVVQSLCEEFALPGAHVSYCIAHPDTIAELKRFYDNSCVTMFPEVLAEALVSEFPKLDGVRGFLYSEIPWMQTMLSLLPGVDIIPAEANYVMSSYRNDGSLSREVPDVAALANQLELAGFLIKKLEGMPGLGSSDYFCVAVRTRQQNEALINAMRTLITTP